MFIQLFDVFIFKEWVEISNLSFIVIIYDFY